MIALALGRAVALPPFGHFLGLSQYNTRDDNDEFDPTDLSFITKMAAIGDSYSAGIGAGDRLGVPLVGEDDSGKQISTALKAFGNAVLTTIPMRRLGLQPLRSRVPLYHQYR